MPPKQFHRQEGTGGGTLSDAQTVEHNLLGPGVIGHILRHRTWNTSTYAATDKWFGYDQVGSVLHETNSAGNLSTRHYQDAWGNVQQSYTTGLWNAGASGWHHNTKETDADAGLVYMYQRWYSGGTGSFLSADPQLGAMTPESLAGPDYKGARLGSPFGDKAQYVFAESNPTGRIDPSGEGVIVIIVGFTVVGVTATTLVVMQLATGNNATAVATCSLQCNGVSPILLKPGAPTQCATALCKAGDEWFGRGGRTGGGRMANAYIEFFNVHCAGPGATVPYFRGPLYGKY